MTLPEATAIVKTYVSGWTTEKLCAVMGFCEDGKMRYRNPCRCLLGVASSSVLHTEGTCDKAHYRIEMKFNPAAKEAESAYLELGYDGPFTRDDQSLRDSRFLAILREVMEEREEATAPATEEVACDA